MIFKKVLYVIINENLKKKAEVGRAALTCGKVYATP